MARLLYLSRTWAMGGAQTILLDLIRTLPPRGLDVLFAPTDVETAEDVKFREAAAAAGAQIVEPLPRKGLARFAGALAAATRRHAIDVVHTHDNVSNLKAAIVRRRIPVPVVATAFGWWEISLKLKAYYALERRLALPKMKLVYTVSDDMARTIVRAGTARKNVRVIKTGIDLDKWAPHGRRGEIRAGFGIAGDALVIGALGRISVEKGFDTLLEAVAPLMAQEPRLVVLLLGRGPDMERLRGIADRLGIGARLVMPGFVVDGAAALEALDLAVLPSVLPEGLPTASLEAQAAGLPIVATDIGGTRETILAGTTGLLVPPRDVAALRAAIGTLIADAPRRETMGVAARERIGREFTVERMMAEMVAFYAEAGAQAKPR